MHCALLVCDVLLQEDLYSGSCIADILVRHQLASADLLTVAVCLVANLAADEVSQVHVQFLMQVKIM